MSLNPWKEDSMAELTATLKYGKGYEESWLKLREYEAAEQYKKDTQGGVDIPISVS